MARVSQFICKNWFLERICQVLLQKRVKSGRITQRLVLNPVELIFVGNLHVSYCTHARKELEINLKTASCSTSATTLDFCTECHLVVLMPNSTGLSKYWSSLMRY